MIRLLRTPLSRGPGRLLVGGLALVLAPSAGWAAGDLEAGKVKAKACAVCHGIAADITARCRAQFFTR